MPLLVLVATLPVLYLCLQPSLPGTDAYYYALQVQSLFEAGYLKIPDSSPIYFLMLPLMQMGFSGEHAVLVYFGISLLLLKFIFWRLWRKGPPLSVLLWLVASPSLFLLSFEFPRQYLALILFACALFFRHRVVVGVGLLVGAVLVHASLLPAVAVATCLMFRERWPRLLWGLMLLTVAGLFTWLIVSGNSHRFEFRPTLPGVITLFHSGWGYLLLLEMAGLFYFGRRAWPALGCAVVATLPAFLPLFNESAMSLGERFALMIPFFLYAFQSLKPEMSVVKTRPLAMATLILAQLSVLAILDIQLFSRYRERQREYAAILEGLRKVPLPPLTISKMGLNYYLKYFLRHETFPYDPEAHWDKSKIWRVVEGVDLSYVFARLNNECLDTNALLALPLPGFLFMREDCFARFRQDFSASDDELVHRDLWDNGKNPNQLRPGWLYSKYRKGEDRDSLFPALPP